MRVTNMKIHVWLSLIRQTAYYVEGCGRSGLYQIEAASKSFGQNAHMAGVIFGKEIKAMSFGLQNAG